MMQQLLRLEPQNYTRHFIHSQERDWAETNCYVDVWIELLHALGHDPVAAMPFTLAVDFEGDQWTFFKFPLYDLTALYDLDVQELAIWNPLTAHIEEQISLGRPVLVELDSYFLPDTAGSAYKLAHVKTTVAVVEIDVEKHHLGYFHGQAYYHLDGDDFIDVFRMRDEPDPAILSPYVEYVKIRGEGVKDQAELLQASKRLLKRQLDLLPEQNPFEKFKPRFVKDLVWLMEQSLETFHQYSFATLRQFGACYELAANYLVWLSDMGESGLDNAIREIKAISETAKVYQFQLARAMTRKKELDLTPIDNMARSWQIAIDLLRNKYSS